MLFCAIQKKKSVTHFEGINGKFKGGRVKQVERDMPKFEVKT